MLRIPEPVIKTVMGFWVITLKKFKLAVRYIGRQFLKTVSSIGRDLLNGENFIGSAKVNLTNTGKTILSDVIDRADKYVEQNGNGLKAKRVYKKKSVKRRKVAKKRATKSIKRRLKKKKTIDFV